MTHDKINEALNEISDDKLAEAAHARPHRRLGWIGALAALLALVIAAGALLPGLLSPEEANPIVLTDNALATPVYPLMAAYPDESKYMQDNDWEAFSLDYTAWREDIKTQRNQPEGYADSLNAFFSAAIPVFLSGSESENTVCSPLNVYMALAMLAEITEDISRQQILDALNATSLEALRTQAGQVWNAHYLDDNASATILANSLWLDYGLRYNADTVQTLAQSYYASVYQADLGTEGANQLLQSWLNAQTHGLLEDQVQNVTLEPETVLALASTMYYRAKWVGKFIENNNTEDIFHTPTGDVTTTFMHRTLGTGSYFWGDDFGATCLDLEDGSKMWLILPDEGYTPADILESGEALGLLLGGDYYISENVVNIRVNLSLPKFDVSGDLKLNDRLKSLGITDAFDQDAANFSPILEEDCFLSTVRHAARVKIDEEGVEAAAYTVISTDASAMPPEEEVDFILDRPFLFVITSHDDLPLFAGIVNRP